MWTIEAFDAAVRNHDAQVAAQGLTIWAGSEPTFTDRRTQTPEWLNTALGGDKEQRAKALLSGLYRRFPGGLVLRSVGRQYPGEDLPRWNLGLYRRRDGVSIWKGPPDPILAPHSTEALPELGAWTHALATAFAARGILVAQVAANDALERRLVVRDGTDAAIPDATDPRLARPSVHAVAIPGSGLSDELAASGVHLFVLRMTESDGRPTAYIELPQFVGTPSFLAALTCLEEASRACQLPALILAGHPPPVDSTVELTTVTPDPAVVEVNTAPSVDAEDFLRRSREIYDAAADQDLAPYRLYFNGMVADSGGGGQITLGGPSPRDSPFLKEPRLLPRLVRFVNRHPSLSYLFSHDFVGSSGQSVRSDERGTDAFDELALELAVLERENNLTPDLLWHSLAPFLCDAFGNSHRAEMNIEKLWNPFLAGRGKLGLVEFRALRMQQTPERATALACLLRSVVAMLARTEYALPLIDWGRELHARFALPFYLEQDLDAVLSALTAAGLGLDDAIESVLRRESFRRWGQIEVPGCALELRRAIEFWPLLGDAASPDQGGGSRLVDASTVRLELRLRPAPDSDSDWHDWKVFAAGVALPMRHEQDSQGALQVFGLRYRSFIPRWGLHPTLGAQAPVRLLLRHPGRPADYLVTLHEWRPDSSAYPGLPEDLNAASQRRADRITLEVVSHAGEFAARRSPPYGHDAYCLDLRALFGADQEATGDSAVHPKS